MPLQKELTTRNMARQKKSNAIYSTLRELLMKFCIAVLVTVKNSKIINKIVRMKKKEERETISIEKDITQNNIK